jgi:hypothetical protein
MGEEVTTMNKALIGLVLAIAVFAGGAMILVDQALMAATEGDAASLSKPIG